MCNGEPLDKAYEMMETMEIPEGIKVKVILEEQDKDKAGESKREIRRQEDHAVQIHQEPGTRNTRSQPQEEKDISARWEKGAARSTVREECADNPIMREDIDNIKEETLTDNPTMAEDSMKEDSFADKLAEREKHANSPIKRKSTANNPIMTESPANELAGKEETESEMREGAKKKDAEDLRTRETQWGKTGGNEGKFKNKEV